MTDHHRHTADKVTTNYDTTTTTTTTTTSDAKAPSGGAPHRHGGHGLMMIACCIPMPVIAVVLVLTGVVGVGFLIVAVACTAMMALTMRGMHGGGHAVPQGRTRRARPTRGTDEFLALELAGDVRR